MSTTITFPDGNTIILPPGSTVSFTIPTNTPPVPPPVAEPSNESVFIDGDLIRHLVPRARRTRNLVVPRTFWYARWNEDDKQFVANNVSYDSLSTFSSAHIAHDNPNRTPEDNGWKSCSVLRNGLWVKCDTLRQ